MGLGRKARFQDSFFALKLMQAQGAKKGAALLEKLDELSATMDRGFASLQKIRRMNGIRVPNAQVLSAKALP